MFIKTKLTITHNSKTNPSRNANFYYLKDILAH